MKEDNKAYLEFERASCIRPDTKAVDDAANVIPSFEFYCSLLTSNRTLVTDFSTDLLCSSFVLAAGMPTFYFGTRFLNVYLRF